MLELCFLFVRGFLVGFRSGRELALENLVLRHQLQIVLRTNPTPRLRRCNRVLWVWFDRLWPASRRHLLIVRPETVLRWHRKGWRLYWTWRSRGRIGRPRLPAEVKDLVAQMSHDNRLWGTERIRGELLKLGIVVSNRSIRQYRWRKPRPEGSQAWRTFLRNHVDGIWAADLFVVQTVGYLVLYVIFFISHGRRELVHFKVTSNPTAAWVWRQLIDATPWARQPSHLIRDGDSVYGRDFDAGTRAVGIIGVQTPRRAPNADAIAERMVRSIRVECMDHLIVINERHLIAVVPEFVDYYNHARPHRSLAWPPRYQASLQRRVR